jgi:sugar phosphate isomerase/epimerase
MKLSCLPVSYFGAILQGTMSIRSWIREAEGLKLDGIDLSILFFPEGSRNRPAEVGRMIADSAVELAIVNTYSDLTHPEDSVRKKEIDTLRRDIQTAAELGAEHVRIVSGQDHPGVDEQQSIRRVLSGFRQAALTAREAGVGLVYENHSKPGNWQYADFSLVPERFLRIAAELEDTDIHILFDTANPIVFGVQPLPLLQKVAERVVCLHAADTRVQSRLEPVVIGTGLVPFGRLFSFLKSKGFSGWISIEEASGTGSEGVETAVRFVRKTWVEPGEADRGNGGRS